MGKSYTLKGILKQELKWLSKHYSTPYRTRIIKIHVTEEEHADFMERLTTYGMSQSEFFRQGITGATVKSTITVFPRLLPNIRFKNNILKIVNCIIENSKGEDSKGSEYFWSKAKVLYTIRP